MRHYRKRKGFTIPEILVSVILIGSLIALISTIFTFIIDTTTTTNATYMNFNYENMLDISREIKMSSHVDISDDGKMINIQDYGIINDSGELDIKSVSYEVREDGLYRNGQLYLRKVTYDSGFEFMDAEHRLVKVTLVYSQGVQYEDSKFSAVYYVRGEADFDGGL